LFCIFAHVFTYVNVGRSEVKAHQ